MKSAEAVARTQASITFTPEGFFKDANETFLAAIWLARILVFG